MPKLLDAYYARIEQNLRCKSSNQILGKRYVIEQENGSIEVNRVPLENGLDLSITKVKGHLKIDFDNTFGIIDIIEIGCCLRGRIEITPHPSSIKMIVNGGETFLSMVDQSVKRYETSFSEALIVSVHFDEKMLNFVGNSYLDNTETGWHCFINKTFGSSFFNSKAAHHSLKKTALAIVDQSHEDMMSYIRIKQLVLGLMLDFFDHHFEMVDSNLFLTNRLTQWVEKHWDEKVTINHLANHFNVSVYFLQKAVKKTTGLSVFQYIRECKMAHAKKLLIDSDLDILQISMEVGYDNPSKFASSFNEHVGFFPKAYRIMFKKNS